MPIPDYQTVMLPLLEELSSRREMIASEAVPALADRFQLTDEELRELLPSGKQEIFTNRVGWARTFLKKAGLLETPERGRWRITNLGEEALRKKPAKIDVRFLQQYPDFLQWWEVRNNKKSDKAATTEEPIPGTPDEILESTITELRDNLASDILEQIQARDPQFFEKLVIDLLVSMGYGGGKRGAAKLVGRAGDAGIDGVIKQDPLGLDVVYIQAKRWDGTVSRPEIQKFAGALQGQRAKKGVFITTSDFTADAVAFAEGIESKIVLINGRALAQLMIDHDIGVTPKETYQVKQLDTDYFTEA